MPEERDKQMSSTRLKVKEDMYVTSGQGLDSSSHLMKAPLLNLLNAVYNQSRYLGRGHRGKVSQCGLHNTTHHLQFHGINNENLGWREKTKHKHLCCLHGSANSDGITGHGAAVTALGVGHHPTILAAKTHLSKLCPPPTSHTELRLDHLNTRSTTFDQYEYVKPGLYPVSSHTVLGIKWCFFPPPGVRS